jgi:hypothetical protein
MYHIIDTEKTPKYLPQKSKKLASHIFLTNKIMVTVIVTTQKKGHFQNFFWVSVFGHL